MKVLVKKPMRFYTVKKVTVEEGSVSIRAGKYDIILGVENEIHVLDP